MTVERCSEFVGRGLEPLSICKVAPASDDNANGPWFDPAAGLQDVVGGVAEEGGDLFVRITGETHNLRG